MIIPVTKEHEQTWAALNDALWPDENSIDEWIKEGHERGLDKEFLYMTEGEAVAFISLSIRNDYVEGTDSNPVGYIEGIYVKPQFQNRGIARALVEFAKKWSAENGCKYLASDCELHNESSRKFHNSVGFEEANTIVCFVMDL